MCSLEEGQQKYNELPVAVRLLLRNIEKVDSHVCLDLVEEGEAPKVWEIFDVSHDHTELDNWVVQSGGCSHFR